MLTAALVRVDYCCAQPSREHCIAHGWRKRASTDVRSALSTRSVLAPAPAGCRAASTALHRLAVLCAAGLQLTSSTVHGFMHSGLCRGRRTHPSMSLQFGLDSYPQFFAAGGFGRSGKSSTPWRNHSLHGDPVFAFARRLVASSLPGCGLPHDSPGCRRRCWRNASCSPPLCRSQKPRTCHPQRRPPLRLAYPQRRPAAPPAPHHNAAPPCPLAAPIYLLSSPRAAAQRWRTRSRVGQTRQLYCVMMSWHLQPHPRKRTCRAGGMTFQGNRPLQSSSWCDTIFRDGS